MVEGNCAFPCKMRPFPQILLKATGGLLTLSSLHFQNDPQNLGCPCAAASTLWSPSLSPILLVGALAFPKKQKQRPH